MTVYEIARTETTKSKIEDGMIGTMKINIVLIFENGFGSTSILNYVSQLILFM